MISEKCDLCSMNNYEVIDQTVFDGKVYVIRKDDSIFEDYRNNRQYVQNLEFSSVEEANEWLRGEQMITEEQHSDNMSIACERASTLTEQDCAKLGIECYQYDEDDTEYFTERAQEIFDEYYDQFMNEMETDY